MPIGLAFTCRANDKVRVERELTKAVELDGKDFAARLDRSMCSITSPTICQPLNARHRWCPLHSAFQCLHRTVVLSDQSEVRQEGRSRRPIANLSASRRRTTYWPLPIAKAMLGEAKAEDVLQAAKVTDNDVMQREQTRKPTSICRRLQNLQAIPQARSVCCKNA